MSDVEVFMESPLLSWLESCLVRPEILSSYSALFDGSIVHSVVLQIDPEPQHHPTKLVGLDGALLANARAKNFDVIVRNLRNLYEEELGQYILRLPDCALLGHRPDSKEGTEQMRLLLTLLLGAAVQCPSKEVFISRIKELDVDTQHGIVEIIKQVTDDQTLVLTAEMKELVQQEQMYTHLLRIMKERDVFHSKWIGSLATEQEMVNSVGGGGGGGGVLSPSQSNRSTPGTATTPSSSGGGGMGHSNVDPNHAAVELADFKSKLRRLRQELEEKSEAFIEVKEELDHKASQYEKLRTESHEWFTEAKRAAAYRDEVDILRERAERADRFEMEIQKLREKLGDSEFYKSRVEELREDNRMLMETKDMVEEQLLRSRKRSDQVMILEAEIIKYKQKLNDMALEMDIDKSKLQELVDENTQLQLAAKGASLPPVADAGLSEDEEDNRSGENSLSEQLTNNAQTRALKLELENRRLNAALEALKESAFKENANKILELEKDKKRLSLKVEQLQENCNRLVSQNNNLESVFQNALDENKKVQDALDARKQTIDRQSGERETDRGKIIDLEKQVETVGKEKQRVQNLSESIQRRADELERSYEAKTRELEALQPKIVELEAVKTKYDDIQSKISGLEKENGNLLKDVMKLRESLETKDVLLDENGAVISNKEREIQTLARELEDRLTEVERVKELEKQYHELISQRQIDLETIGTLQENLVGSELQMDKVKQGLQKLGLCEQEVESSEFSVEVMLTKLVKNPETFKTVKEVVLSVGRRGSAGDESDGEEQQQRKSSDMCVLCHRKEIFTVEKNIEFTNENEQRRENGLILRVPLDKISSTEVNNLKVQCDRLCEEKTELSASLEQMKTEMARHKVEVSTLNSQVVSLNTQQIALQVANSQLVAEKDALLKQLDIMRHQSESMSNDQLSLQFLHDQLTSEYETLNGEKENMRTTLRDLRVENRDLRERLMAAEKTRKELRQEIDSTKTDAAGLSSLKQEHSKLKDDFRNLFTQSDRMKQEYKNMQEQYRAMRSENGQLKLQHTELQGELNNRIDVATGLDIDLTKVSQRCEMLLQMNANLDSDRRTLMDHVSQLLSQYHELLVTSLDDKQHYHDEEKQFTDRVNNLHRQKEKLEDKIMEHYRKLDSCSPKKKAFASTLVKRVRKAGSELMSKVPSRQNRRSWIEDPRLTQSQNLGSESGGNDSDNSLEEPSSLTESRPLNRHSNFRQSLQRKPADLKLLEASLVRGGAVRSSLHTLTSNNNTSTPTRRTEKTVAGGPPPSTKEKLNAVGPTTTDVANVVNLGGAGSRRTVYLDEMLIKTEPINNNRSPSNSISMGKAGTAAATSASSASTSPALNGASSTAGQPAGGDAGGSSASAAAAAPTTLLMYNRISNIISPLPNEGDNQQQGSDKFGSSSSQTSNTNNNNNNSNINNNKGGSSLEDKEKESAIWYEYGCV